MLGLHGRSGPIIYAAASLACWLSGVVGAPISRSFLYLAEIAPDMEAARLWLSVGNVFGLAWTLGFTALFFIATVRRARDIGLPPLMTFVAWKVLTIAEAATAAAWSPEVSTPVGDWRLSSLAFQAVFTALLILLPSKAAPEADDDPGEEPREREAAMAPPAPLTPSSSRAAFGLRVERP